MLSELKKIKMNEVKSLNTIEKIKKFNVFFYVPIYNGRLISKS
jgi:hypothetical protein